MKILVRLDDLEFRLPAARIVTIVSGAAERGFVAPVSSVQPGTHPLPVVAAVRLRS